MAKYIKKVEKHMKNLKNKMTALAIKVKSALCNKKAEGYVDTGLKILISVVIGALLLTALYALFGDTIMPTLTEKIQGLFNYSGT